MRPGLPEFFQNHKPQAAGADLLVALHRLHQAGQGQRRFEPEGQPVRGEHGLDTRHVGLRQQLQPRRQPRRGGQPDRDGLAVKVALETGDLFDRVAEGVAEVKQRTAVGRLQFELVVLDHGGLERTAAAHDVRRARIGRLDQGPVGQIGQQLRIAQQPVFHDLPRPRGKLPRRQRGQKAGVDENHPRLVEGPRKVLARGQIDAGLPAHRAVDHGKQRRWNLDKIDPAQERRRREAGQIAEHAAAQRDHDGAAVELAGRQELEHLPQPGHGLAPLARRQRQHGAVGKRRPHPRPVQAGHGGIGHHGELAAAPAPVAHPHYHDRGQAVAEDDRVAPLTEVDVQFCDHAATR